MDPLKNYRRHYGFFRKCCGIVGMDVTNINHRLTLKSMVPVNAILFYIIFTIYTIWIRVHDDWIIVPESLCLVGSAVQGASKFLTFYFYKDTLRDLNAILENTYEFYQHKQGNWILILRKVGNRFSLIFKIYTLSWFSAALILYVVPLFLLFFTGRKVLIMHFVLPAINPETNIGYLSTMIIHAILIFSGGFGNYCGDIIFVILSFHTELFSKLLRQMFEEVDEVLKDGFDGIEAEMRLVECIKFHEKFCRYLDKVNHYCFWICFNAVTTSAISILLSIFISLIGNWTAGYAYVFICFLVISTHCFLGSFVETNNDSIADYIYDIKWYDLPINAEKMLLIMQIKTQRPINLSVGGFAPLNIDTWTQVMKGVYSTTMIMLQFTK